MTTLALLCAGAAKGLATALAPRWTAQTGVALDARYGAVGAMKEALLAGQPCDVFVVSAAMVDALVADGTLRGGTRADLGRVPTGLAVRRGAPVPAASDAGTLRAALLAADALYFPDPERATAGIHFAQVLRGLGIHEALGPRCRTFANGAAAMRELAAGGTPRSIGCTQATEIRYTEGVDLVGALPAPFELITVYAAAVTRRSAQPELAASFVELLAGPGSRELRAAGGFELEA
jgi:molybdate transport system substrate-binding protein